MATLVTIIGIEPSKEPYTTNNAQPIEFMIRKVLIFFIKKDTNTPAEAK